MAGVDLRPTTVSLGWSRDKNIGLFGGTRQGKSVGANQIMAEDPRVGVYFAPDPEPWMVGATVHRPAELVEGLKAGRKKFVVPTDLWDDPAEAHRTWTAGLLYLCDKYPIEVTMVHDEFQDLDQDAARKAAKRGLKRGFRNVFTTQSPASTDVDLEPLRQCDYYAWVGPVGSFELEYVRDKRLFEAPEDMRNTPDHTFVAVTRTGREVARGQFDNRRFGDG